MEIKKFNQYITESNSEVSKIEIKEFALEETKSLISDLYEKMAKKFPIDSSKLSDDEKTEQDKIILELCEHVTKVTIQNISVLNDTKSEEKD